MWSWLLSDSTLFKKEGARGPAFNRNGRKLSSVTYGTTHNRCLYVARTRTCACTAPSRAANLNPLFASNDGLTSSDKTAAYICSNQSFSRAQRALYEHLATKTLPGCAASFYVKFTFPSDRAIKATKPEVSRQFFSDAELFRKKSETHCSSN